MSGKTLTLENMCVMGLVTLMLNNPATQSRKPNTPVMILPQMNTEPFQSRLLMSSNSVPYSPWMRMNGAKNNAEPRFCQYASWMVELCA